MESNSLTACIALITLFSCSFAANADTPLHAGLKITSSQSISAGTYTLSDEAGQPGIVQISGKGFTVDFHGAKLIGPGTSAGVGIKITDAKNVTILNASVSGYLWGFVLERCSGVRLIHCTSSRNADLPPGTVIDESGTSPEDTHGGGFVLRGCGLCRFEQCRAQYQWDGIDLVHSTNNTIEDGDYSYNGNWGMHLWSSSNNTFQRNRAVWCTTGSGLLYQSLSGWQTYDSQAVGIDHNSNDNIIAENDLRFGGDGIFIRANEGGQSPGHPVPVKNGSNRNRLMNNDCSFSPNNAIEVDFVEDTVIEGNNCSNSNYGLWLGYSVRSIVRSNTCVNDSTHAVEIENGQNGVFESNVFGWDTPRPDRELILLRQNGNDKTPSGPYKINRNLFYGSGSGIRLLNTAATLDANYTGRSGINSPEMDIRLVIADSRSTISEHFTSVGSNNVSVSARNRRGVIPPRTRVRGSVLSVPVPNYNGGEPVPLIEMGRVPLWIRQVRRGKARVWVPDDNWNLPMVPDNFLTVRTARGGFQVTEVRYASASDTPAIWYAASQPLHIGDNFTAYGLHLDGGRFLLNGRVAEVVSRDRDTTILKSPENILTPTHYNLVWEKGEGEERVATWPVTLFVDVPNNEMPHLLSASFSPTTVKVGELLKVTMTVRNNLPVPAHLTTIPKPKFTYDEKQAWYEMGYTETPGSLNLRVSTDFVVGGHDPGSWPWMFGFDMPELKPGETTTVTGFVRLQTPGPHTFRIGLVAGGSRFIDDNAYQTKITVVPK